MMKQVTAWSWMVPCIVGVACVVQTRAENWPEFRGPTGQGLSTAKGLPVAWSDSKNVAWKQPIPGEGWSSPIYVDEKIYLTSAVPVKDGAEGDRDLAAFCLDARTGEIIWRKDVFLQLGKDAPRIHKKNSHASPTPLLYDGRVYVHFGHQGTACLDLKGEVIWKQTDLKYRPVHGAGGSPILVDDHLIYSADGGREQVVVALRKDSGKVAWKTKREVTALKKFAFSTPLLIEVNGRKQVVSPGSHAVNAYDPKTGTEIWKVRTNGYSTIPRPVYGNGLIFLCTGYDSPELYAVRLDGEGDVTDTHIAWRLAKGVPHTASLLLSGKELYMVSDRGVASCFDAATGKEHWRERLGGNYSASPLVADGLVYFLSEDGKGTVVKAGKTFQQVAVNELGERTLASYAVGGGDLFIRSAEHLYRFQAP